MNRKVLIIGLLIIMLIVSAFIVEKPQAITIYMIGYSTMADKPPDNENHS